MPTNILRTPINRKVQNLNGDAVSSATATVYILPSSATATVYSAETGAATISQPFLTDIDGSIPGWLEIGLYSIKIESTLGTATSRYYASHPQQSLLQGTAITDSNLEIKDDGDSSARFAVNAGGTIMLGSGSGTADVTLYRAGAGTLTTDGVFNASTNLKVQNDDIALVIKLNKEVFG